jgi:hypothetical protein
MPDDADWQQQEIEEMEDFWEFVDEKTGEFKEDSSGGGSPRGKLSPIEGLGCALVFWIVAIMLYQFLTRSLGRIDLAHALSTRDA